MKRNTLCAASLVLGLMSYNSALAATMQQTKAQKSSKALQVTVDDQGFHPANLKVQANVPSKITFVRTSNKTCATTVVIPGYNIKRELPLNKSVTVELKPAKTGEVAFACGMGMLKGKLVVTDK